MSTSYARRKSRDAGHNTFDLDRPTSSPFGIGASSSPSPSSSQPLEVDPAKQGPLLATLAAQGARVFVDLAQVAHSFNPEAALKLTPSQLYDHLVAQGIPAEDARVLRAQEVDGSNFSLINDGQLERWGVAPWGRRVALVQALQALAFGPGGRPRPSDLLRNEQAYVGFDANRERAQLSLHNGGLANGYGLGRERYRPTERELMREERERALTMQQYAQRERDELDAARDARIRPHTYAPSPVDEYRERDRLLREREHDMLLAASTGGGRAARVPRGLDRFGTYEENEPYYGQYADQQRGDTLYSPTSRMGMGKSQTAPLAALSIREREALEREREALEREREEAHQAREAARMRARMAATGGRPMSASAASAAAYGRDSHSAYLGRTTGGGGGDPYTTSFEQAERDRAADRAALARRDRDRLDAARYGASLGSPLAAASTTGGGGSYTAHGYDSDEDRQYHHPRLNGGYASYFKREFGAYAEPLTQSLGGGGGPAPSSNWLEEFYRPVDVRGSRSQWLPSLQPPSYSLRNNPSPPEARLKLEWVYGYTSASSGARHNVFYNNVGDIVYPVASNIVVYKHRHRIQRHFQAHTDEVRALAQHPVNLNIFASGQTGGEHTSSGAGAGAGTSASASSSSHVKAPHLAVWDSTDFSRVWVLPLTASDRSVRALAFSGDGRFLASVSNDADHTIKLWDWETRTLLGSARGDSYALFAIKWNHKDPAEFITAGKQHLVFWRFDGAKLTARKAHIPGGRSNVSFYSVAFSEKGYACVGGDDGSIFVFVDGRLVREFKKLHRGKVLALDWFPGGLVSGGGDGVVHVLDKKLDVLRSFTFHHRVVALYARGNLLLVGTQGSQIFEIKDFVNTQVEGDTQSGLAAGQPLVPIQGGAGGEWQSPTGRIGLEPIVQGHYDGELHAVAITPGGREIVTAGEDNQLQVWDMTTHRLLRRAHISDKPGAALTRKARPGVGSSSHPLHQCARAVAVSPNGKFIAVGTNAGELVVYTAHDLRRVHSHDMSQYSKRAAHAASSSSRHAHPHWIQALKYSPNGHVLAVGTHGSIIALLDTRDEYRVRGVLSSHESFITALDFSDDGAFLASTDGLYHLKFHQLFEDDLAQSQLVLDPHMVRDVKWAGQNCVLGFAVQGVLETGEAEGDLVQCLEVSPSRAFVVSGDDAGQPVLGAGHRSHAYHSHSSNVVSVRWSLDEKYVVSVGGHDNAICQYSIVPA